MNDHSLFVTSSPNIEVFSTMTNCCARVISYSVLKHHMYGEKRQMTFLSLLKKVSKRDEAEQDAKKKKSKGGIVSVSETCWPVTQNSTLLSYVYFRISKRHRKAEQIVTLGGDCKLHDGVVE